VAAAPDAVTLGLLLASAALVLIAALSFALLLNAEGILEEELIGHSRHSSARRRLRCR
jgi:hypothetical protein